MSDETRTIVQEEFEMLGNPSKRKFVDWLMEEMSKEGDNIIKSHVTILNWENGDPPKTEVLEDMLSVYEPSDRRFKFALKMLAAKKPHIWGFEGVVWRLRDVIKKV